ncbi:aldolase [Penicillium macrosclerotiorum]|uniref:aldolase n=1 Tax=Penicillium macrosclerotiorum TaxID=303699 RepID=UPI00254835A4|nr:aldolase [Penicillium macrosclerotiorum]KAJ5683497.1 aldolase [Penicillium macrosclerotiorum]
MIAPTTPREVRIVEVGPRDGLQNIAEQIPTATKLDLIRRLEGSGLRTIELTSVVSPRAIPQLADCREVLGSAEVKALLQNPVLRLPVLVPNVKGLEIAIQHGVREIAVFISATEGFSRANINCSVEQGMERAREVAALALKSNVAVRGYVSCIFADPYDGTTPEQAVLSCIKALLHAGCYEVSLGDTLGIGSPASVRRLITYLTKHGVPLAKLAGHFHDTYGQAVANVWEAYNCGMRVFDSSVGGLGGCPFAPGAKGNVASEDLVYMFHNAGVSTGIDLTRLVDTGVWISKQLKKPNSSRAGNAFAIKAQPAPSLPPRSKPQHMPLQWTLLSEPDGLELYRSGVNLKIVLSRPKNGNALTLSMIEALTTVINDASRDPQTARIVITGVGRFFCTGMDLGQGSTPVAQGSSTSDAQFMRLTALFEAIDRSPKVTIACINGPAFGGGVGLAFSCDIRLCARNAIMTLSEVKLGLCAATISKYVIREWGVAFAREAMLSARPVAPAELKARGLISDVLQSLEQLDERLDSLLGELRVASPDASRMSKDLVKLAWAHAGGAAQAEGIQALFNEMMRPGADGGHGVEEFQAGRKVDWDAYMQRHSKSKL